MKDSLPLLFSLLHAGERLGARVEAAMAEANLSGARFGVLDTLSRAGGPMTLGELAASQSCVRSNMTQLIDRLESEGLVRRASDPADRRSVRAELTEEGRSRHAAGAEVIRRLEGELDAHFCADEHAALRGALARLEKFIDE